MPPQPNIPNNAEIDQALKEFEIKSNANQTSGQTETQPKIQAVITPQTSQAPTHEVEGVSFDTDKEAESYTAIKFYKETVEPKMVKAVIKLSGGTVKNQRQAEWILLGFVVVAIGVSLFLFINATHHTTDTPSPLFLEQVKQMSSKNNL